MIKTDTVQQVYDVFDKMEKPTGHSIFIPKYVKGAKKGEYISGLSHRQQIRLGQHLSEEAFPDSDFRYALLSLNRAYKLVYENSEQGINFIKLNDENWFRNREVILPDAIMPDPVVDEHLMYHGVKIEAMIDTESIIDTLIEADMFKMNERLQEPRPSTVHFKNGEATIMSTWERRNGCFRVITGEPYTPEFQTPLDILSTFAKENNILTAFEKTKIADSEYKEFLELAKTKA